MHASVPTYHKHRFWQHRTPGMRPAGCPGVHTSYNVDIPAHPTSPRAHAVTKPGAGISTRYQREGGSTFKSVEVGRLVVGSVGAEAAVLAVCSY